MAVDYTTDIGKVRVLTGDVYEDSPGFMMTDEELTAILGLNGNIIALSAATALETMATKHASIMQKIRTLDLQTDGPAVAKALLDRAQLLRKQYQEKVESEEGSDFEIFPVILNANQYEDWLLKQYWSVGL
jgi:hypothetical protein